MVSHFKMVDGTHASNFVFSPNPSEKIFFLKKHNKGRKNRKGDKSNKILEAVMQKGLMIKDLTNSKKMNYSQ